MPRKPSCSSKSKAVAPPESEKPRAKRTKKDAAQGTAGRRLRGKRGVLQDVQECPLDVLLEIFSYLDPQDLLRLSRTSKDLRGILLQKFNAFVWRAARVNVDMPAPPEDMSEPALAHLIFDSLCHMCWTNRALNVMWTFGVRCCKKCIPTTFISAFDIGETTANGVTLPWNVLGVLPYMLTKSHDPLFYIPHLDRARQEYALLDTSKQNQIKVWLKKNGEATKLLKARFIEHQAWEMRRIGQRSQQLDEIRARRQNAILDKLKELGWEDEIRFTLNACFAQNKTINQPKELTERIWTRIEPEMISFMGSLKAGRLKIEHDLAIRRRYGVFVKLYADHILTLLPDVIMPSVADVAMDETFRAALHETPMKDGLFEERIGDAMLRLPEAVARWKNATDNALFEIVKEGSDTETGLSLSLATTVFRCSHLIPALTRTVLFNQMLCNDIVTYPDILTHRCASSPHSFRFDSLKESLEEMRLDDILVDRSFGTAGFRLHKEAQARAVAIVQACGMDPLTTTFEDMEALDPFLKCNEPLCKGGVQAMRWLTALRHDHGGEPLSSGPSYSALRLSEDAIHKVEKREREQMECRIKCSPTYCMYCPSRSSPFDKYATLFKHLRDEHAIHKPSRKDWKGDGSQSLVTLSPSLA